MRRLTIAEQQQQFGLMCPRCKQRTIAAGTAWGRRFLVCEHCDHELRTRRKAKARRARSAELARRAVLPLLAEKLGKILDGEGRSK